MLLCVCAQSGAIFDAENAGGTHVCRLDDAYERAVAWELIELAWGCRGENIKNETLNGVKFDIPEPPAGIKWTRDEWALPDEGVLKLDYIQIPEVPRLESVMTKVMMKKLINMLTDEGIIDEERMALLELACHEFYFTAELAGLLVSLFRVSVSKVEVVGHLLPKIVDPPNLTADVFDFLTDHELRMLEARIGQLLHFVPCK